MFLLILLTLYIIYRVSFWMNEGQKLQIAGYLPPAPSIFGRRLLIILSRLGSYLFVGTIKVRNKENISFDERLLVISNHQFALDFMVLACALPYRFRHLAKAEEVRGWRAPLAAFTGHFAVHVDNGKAKSGTGPRTVDACVRVLTDDSDSRLLIFPQGKIVADNVLMEEDFRTGAVRAFQLAAEKMSGSLFSIQPVAIQYQRDPKQGSFLSVLAAKFRLRCFAGVTNYGANVIIGEPISVGILPKDIKQATQVLRNQIQILLDGAKEKYAGKASDDFEIGKKRQLVSG